MNSIDWTKEHRQAPIGLILFFADTVRKLIKASWAVILLLIFKNKEEDSGHLYLWLILGGSAFLLINALLSYWFFRFQLIDDELVVKKGYLKKIRLTVPLDRIQTIQIKQNIIQQAIGLVTLEVDTAGSAAAEIKFIALKEETAELLKEEFQSKISQNEIPISEDEQEENQSTQNKEPLSFQLGMRDLFKVGLSENHFRSFFVIVSILYWAYYQIESIFEEKLDAFAEEGIEAASGWSDQVYIYLIITVLLLTLSISFARAFIGFYNLNLKSYTTSFKLHFGLFNVKEFNIPFNKIQFISWHNNPIRSLFNFQSLKIKQASSSENQKKKRSIEIPACKREAQHEVEHILFGSKDQAFSEWHRSHWIYFINMFILANLISFALSAAAYGAELPAVYIFIGLEIISLAFVYLAFKKRAFRTGNTMIEMRKGQVATEIYKMKSFKVQSVGFHQNFIMRYKKRASLTIYTAAGKHLNIPYIQEDLAKETFNYLLYKVESSNEPWM